MVPVTKSYTQIPLLFFAPRVTEVFTKQVKRNVAPEMEQELLFLRMRPLLHRDILPIDCSERPAPFSESQFKIWKEN